ncbi:MAG: GH3 auxin-responsive promoter family protein [Gemmataceae bacterium]
MRFPHFLTKLAGKLVALPIRRKAAAFEAATRDPLSVQESLRQRIVHRHAQTQFGRDHNFATITSLADFRENLPIAPYEYFEPYLKKVRQGNFSALLADTRIHMFALTSGTTAARKFIPVTDQYLADYRRGWNIWGLRAYLDHPAVKLQPIVQLSGDWNEFETECGIPCGAVTGLTAKMQKRLIRWLYCVPPSVGRVKDAAAKYYLALRLSLPRPVGMIMAANPSTLVNLARAGDAEKECLIRDLHDGTLNSRLQVPADVRSELMPRIAKRHPERAKELEAIVRRTGTLYPKDYWSPHCLLGNWTGGSVSAYLRHYPRYYGPMPVRDVGLIASEGRMTIPLADNTSSGVLDITSHFFEFLPEEEAQSAKPTVLGSHELQEGGSYFILLTTASGLYRYHIHDLVRVTGFHNRTPLIEFLSKGSHIANMTGEKLSEHQVANAMAEVLRELDLTVTAYTLAPCWDDTLPYYTLFLEQDDVGQNGLADRFVSLLDQRLAEKNDEYAAKRSSARLGKVRLEVLPSGTWHHWDRQRLIRTGGSLEQYKHPCLIPDPKFHESLHAAMIAAKDDRS